MEKKSFVLAGFASADRADSDQACFVVPVFLDKDGEYFIQNAKLEKLTLSDDVDVCEFEMPTTLPEINRRDDLLYAFLYEGSVFVAPYRLLARELRKIRKTLNFHDMEGVLIDHFINDMEKIIFSSAPTLSLMKFSIT